MNEEYVIHAGESDELLVCLLEILSKLYNGGFDSVHVEEINLNKPYEKILKAGMYLCLGGLVYQKSFWKSELTYFLLSQKEIDKKTVLEIHILEQFVEFFQRNADFEEFYNTVALIGSNGLMTKYNSF